MKFLTNFLHCQLIFSLGHCLGVLGGARIFSPVLGRQATNPKLPFFFSFLRGVWSSNSCGHVISVYNFIFEKKKVYLKEMNFLNRNFIG